MVVAGLDNDQGDYAKFVSTQNALFSQHLVDDATGVFWHGRDALTGRPSCCKWGRANGWAMMSHVETLSALNASRAPFAKEALQQAQRIFLKHAKSLIALQVKECLDRIYVYSCSVCALMPLDEYGPADCIVQMCVDVFSLHT